MILLQGQKGGKERKGSRDVSSVMVHASPPPSRICCTEGPGGDKAK